LIGFDDRMEQPTPQASDPTPVAENAAPPAPSMASRIFGVLPPLLIGGSVAGWGLFLGLVVWKPGQNDSPPVQVVEDHRVEVLNDRDFPLLPELPTRSDNGKLREVDPNFRHQLQVADDLLRDGSASRAMELYADLVRDQNTNIAYDALAYRFTLAREVQGDFGRAVVLYRDLVRMSEDPRIVTAAVLGQARVLLRSGELDAARLLLCRSLSLPSVVDCRDPTLVGEIIHVLAQVDAQEILRGRFDDLLADNSCAVAEPNWSIDQVLSLIDRSSVASETEIQSVPVVVHRQFENRPQDAILSTAFQKLPLNVVTDHLSQALAIEIEWSERAAHSLESETETLVAANLTLGTVLDLLAISHALTWTRTDNHFFIKLDDELDTSERLAQRLARSQRTLLAAIANHPTHRFAPYCHLALGNLYFLDNNLEGASTEYRQVTQKFPTSKINTEASFNLAKVLLAQNRQPEALTHFYRAVDTGTGHPLRATAYAFVGRMQLEAGNIRDAIRPLMRGLSVADGDPVQPTLAVLLAGGYLMADNAHAANAVLMEYRSTLARSPQKHLAALLASLARFQAIRDPKEREDPGRSLVMSIEAAASKQWFGHHTPLILGRAYDAIGMASEMAILLEEALKHARPGWVADQMRSRLADHFRVLGDNQKAIAFLTDLEKSADLDAVRDASLRKADLALSMGLANECLGSCYTILEQEGMADSYRREALRLLGQTYALHDDHENAALCFAGMIPVGRPPVKQVDAPGAPEPANADPAPSDPSKNESHALLESS
jgi:tetratricopeptide (TPR) repeat protein